MAVFTLVVLAAVTGLLTVAVRGRHQDSAGHRGSVDVTGCTFASYATHGDIYRCGGNFTADDGTFTLPYVSFSNDGRLDPGAHVDVIVAGPAATTATEVTESRARLLVTVGGAILLAAFLLAVWRLWLKARAATRE
jgi:hypothetical protein